MRPIGTRKTILVLGLAGLCAIVCSCALVYLFVDPEPTREDEPEAAADFSPPSDSQDGSGGGSGLDMVQGGGIAAATSGGGDSLRPPDVGKIAAAGGRERRSRRPPAGRDWTVGAAGASRKPADHAKAPRRGGPFNRLSAALHAGLDAVFGGGVPPRGDAVSSVPAAQGVRRVFAAAAVSAARPQEAPRAGAGTSQRALSPSRSGLSYAPIGPVASTAQTATSAASPGAASATSSAPPGPADNGGASWGAHATGGGSTGDALALTKVGAYHGTVWGLDLASLYKKLKALGVTEAQFKALENCLAGENGCTGGDIWEACTKAAVYSACRSVCHETPGCKDPSSAATTGGGTTATTAGPGGGCINPDGVCEPALGENCGNCNDCTCDNVQHDCHCDSGGNCGCRPCPATGCGSIP